MTARLRDDCFALPPGVDWTPVDTALARLRAALSPVTAIERVPLSGALGRILASDVAALRSNPPADNAAVDGYAFAWDAAGADVLTLPLADGRAAAGEPFAGRVADGHAVRILTGAEVPAGTDTVVLQEDCTVSDGAVAFPRPRKRGANCRRAGEDAATGESVAAAGRRIGAADLARLSAVGIAELPVRAVLGVGVLSTGDELLQPGADPAAPGVYDANRPMLSGLLEAFGHRVVDLGARRDRAGMIRDALDEGARTADAIITSGGASSGDEDHISRLLREEGTVETWRIAVKPGRPLMLGFWRG
ncbi:MAG: molybdopterin-binding protein, partial [Pseudomonadota bacterium]